MFGTILLLALREVRRHLMRSFLTTLGIIIGVSSVVTMVTLGNGATAAVQEQWAGLGANVLTVRPGQGFGRGGGGPQPPLFKESDLEAIRGQVAGVKTVAPQNQSAGTVVYGGQNWSTTIIGTSNDYFAASGITLDGGRLFTDAEMDAGKAVCVVGMTVVSNLFKEGDPIGKVMRVRGIACEVIGLMKKRGSGGFGQDQDDQVVMPIKVVMRRFTGNRDVRAIQVSVDQAYSTSAVSEAITNLMRERRKIDEGEDDNFNIFDTKQLTDAISKSSQTMTAV
jgi:putative ABC transport system permease protein